MPRLGEVADPRVDVFAIGVMLKEMLGGSEHVRLSEIAARSCALDPKQRFASAVELASALDGREASTLASLPPAVIGFFEGGDGEGFVGFWEAAARRELRLDPTLLP